MRRLIDLSIHGELYFVFFDGINLSIAASTSDLKLTHMSLTDMLLWSDMKGTSRFKVLSGHEDHPCLLVCKGKFYVSTQILLFKADWNC